MNLQFNINNNNHISYQDTPWDNKTLLYKSREIHSLNYSDQESLESLVKYFNLKNEKDRIELISVRIPAQDFSLKSVLQKNGYRFIEVSLKMKLCNFENLDFNHRLKNVIKLQRPAPKDFDQIRNIARDDFNFGRFHEDPLIQDERARERYYYWVGDLLDQGKEFFIYKKDEDVISFIAYQIRDSAVELILGGSRSDYGYASYYFWSSLIDYFSKSNIKAIDTMISAANTGILNLYIKFGFSVTNTLFGFHKTFEY